MDMLVPILAASLASLSTTATAAADRGAAARSPSVRHDLGITATVFVRARIIRTSASIGANLPPPVPRMTPRRTTVSAADGRPVPALVYDFE